MVSLILCDLKDLEETAGVLGPIYSFITFVSIVKSGQISDISTSEEMTGHTEC